MDWFCEVLESELGYIMVYSALLSSRYPMEMREAPVTESVMQFSS